MSWLNDLQQNDYFTGAKAVIDTITSASSDPKNSQSQQQQLLDQPPVEQQINAQTFDPSKMSVNVGGMAINPLYIGGAVVAALSLFMALR
ncbi:MAG: hypothetical protein IBX55_18625 [Methyloprofundus sp.]|nr:hypothetical protein [Methyloprofundus sp.]